MIKPRAGRKTRTYVLHLYRRGAWEESVGLAMRYRAAVQFAKERCRAFGATMFKLSVDGRVAAEAALGKNDRFSWFTGTNQDSDL